LRRIGTGSDQGLRTQPRSWPLVHQRCYSGRNQKLWTQSWSGSQLCNRNPPVTRLGQFNSCWVHTYLQMVLIRLF
ncbi:hypothetical protein LINGRAHAP2_LOCUS30614, partial [Linum grandiflorum]